MAGKWEKLKGKFNATTSVPGLGEQLQDPRFVEKVAQTREGYAPLPLKDLLFKFHEIDHQKDQLNDEIKALNVDLAALGQLIKQHFDNMDVRSVQTEFGQTVYLQSEPVVKVEDRGLYEAYVAGHPDLEYMWSINPQVTKTFVKGLLEQDQDDQIPPGLKIDYDTSVRIKKTA
jgi:hypothetical protein